MIPSLVSEPPRLPAMPPLTLVVGAFLLLFLIVREIRTYLSLRQFGGHWSAGFSRLWLLRVGSSGRMNEHYTELNSKYGNTARIGPRMLVTCDAALIRKMNAVRSPYTRSKWYQALRLHPTRDNITSYRDETIHSRLRTQMSYGYSGKENLFLERDIDNNLDRLSGLIEEKYISTQYECRPLDLARITTFFTLDVISTVAFGKSFGFLEKDEDPFDYLKQLHIFLPAIIFFGVYPEIQKIMRLPFMQKLAPKATDANGIGKVMGFAKEVVAERFGDNKIVRKDMLGSFLSHGLSQEQLESETLTQITAGSDSTASAIRMIMFLIATNPQIYSRLMNELLLAEQTSQLSRPIIRDAESRRLPYLQACIKEGLRIYPPVTGLLAKEVPVGGDFIDGRFVPAGTMIGWNSWALMRDRALFGEDVDLFRPERWLEGGGRTADQRAQMEDQVSLCFGYGRFGCLGRPVAVMEINKTVPELLLRFTFQVMNPSHPFLQRTVGFYLHDNMTFRVERRHAGSNSPVLVPVDEPVTQSKSRSVSESSSTTSGSTTTSDTYDDFPRNPFEGAEHKSHYGPEEPAAPKLTTVKTCGQDFGMCGVLENVDLMDVSV